MPAGAAAAVRVLQYSGLSNHKSKSRGNLLRLFLSITTNNAQGDIYALSSDSGGVSWFRGTGL